MYVFCMSVCFSAAAYLFFLFISFFCKGKNLPFWILHRMWFQVFLRSGTWKKVKPWCEFFFFFSLLFFFTVHLQHAGKVPRQQSTRSQQHSSALDPDRLIWSAALMPLKSLRKPLHHLFFPPIDNFSLSLLLLAAWLDLIYETKCAFAGWLKQSFGTSIKSHLMSYECRNLSTSPRLTFTTARIIIGAGKLTLTWWCQGWLWIFLFFFCLYECTMTRTSHI